MSTVSDNPTLEGQLQRLLDERAVERFIAHEARLADEARYADWEALWADDALYWVPANRDDADPTQHVSYIYDNRKRIASRIGQLLTGSRHAQTPPSRLHRVLSTPECTFNADGSIAATATFMLMEIRNDEQRLWSGRVEYLLARNGDGFRLRRKKVLLTDNAAPIRALPFLI